MKERALFLAGVSLVFVSGMFYSLLVPLILVEVAGARLQVDVADTQSVKEGEPAWCEGSVHPDCVSKPPEAFYVSVLLHGLYGAPFAAAGSYLIKKYRKY